jgi:hypothetical protein
MKYIKLFESFINCPKCSHIIDLDIISILEKFEIENYTINTDGTIDVDGDVYLNNRNINDLTVFSFGKVTGDFNCSYNKLKSLEGSPYYVGGDFDCSNNKLSNLVGSPKEVGDSFFCNINNLDSLEGMTLEIGGIFDCRYNSKLKELDCISNIEGEIYCDSDLDVSKFRGFCKKIEIS